MISLTEYRKWGQQNIPLRAKECWREDLKVLLNLISNFTFVSLKYYTCNLCMTRQKKSFFLIITFLICHSLVVCTMHVVIPVHKKKTPAKPHAVWKFCGKKAAYLLTCWLINNESLIFAFTHISVVNETSISMTSRGLIIIYIKQEGV